MKDALIIGGGIAGIQASLDLADMGIGVHLVERLPTIGGRMAQLDKTYPTNDCSTCILSPKMNDCARHPNITLHTYAEITTLTGSSGNFTATILKHPRYVDETKCTACGECVLKCPAKVPDAFDMELRERKAIYLYFPQAVPQVMTIDPDHCIYLDRGKCGACVKVCQAEAIDFEQTAQEIELDVGAVVVATGYEDAETSRPAQMAVDLAVLATSLIPRPDAAELAQMLGIELDSYGFVKTDPLAPVDTTRTGAFTAGCCRGPSDIPESVMQASAAAARAARVVGGV
ncbi:MAG: FAD-dependent oxidoreductase [Chloroflexota bacterium]|nr:FAD-dependent oxidoreductase [Chloroflexota bacterium]